MTDEPVLSTRDILLELRSDMKSIKTALEGKADRSRVHELASQVTGIDLLAQTVARLTTELTEMKMRMGELDRTVSHLSDTMDGRIDERMEQRSNRGWTTGQRVIALVGAALLVGNFILNYLTLYPHAH